MTLVPNACLSSQAPTVGGVCGRDARAVDAGRLTALGSRFRAEMAGPRVIVVAKRTSYQRFVEEEGDPRASLLVKRRDPTVKSWLPSHADHQRTLDVVVRELSRAGAQTLLLRRAHAAFDTSDAELVIAVGGDGTLLAASHNVDDVPILGVNSAPNYSIGFFCGATRKDFRERLEQALAGKLRKVTLARMAVSLNGRMRSKRV